MKFQPTPHLTGTFTRVKGEQTLVSAAEEKFLFYLLSTERKKKLGWGVIKGIVEDEDTNLKRILKKWYDISLD